MTRKAERLVNLIVLLLNAGRPITAAEIRDTIPGYDQGNDASFKRMFERDKDELRKMGIPLEIRAIDVWEVEEGYLIPKDRYYLPDLELTGDELTALRLAAEVVRLSDPSQGRSAMWKIGAGDPDPAAQAAAPLSADVGLTTASLPDAFEAVSRRRTVTFGYRSLKGESRRTVDPYGLAQRKGFWYLAGMDRASGEIRSFRLDRMTTGLDEADAAGAGPQFEVPEGFSPGRLVEVPPFAQEAEESTPATVRFDSDTAWRVMHEEPWLALRAGDDGGAEAEVPVRSIPAFLGWVLSYGDGAEVVSPPDVRLAIRAHLEELCG